MPKILRVELSHDERRASKSYNPELNDIELVWWQAQYEDYPQRTQPRTDAIGQVLDKALTPDPATHASA
ncbi:hypothetical protein ACFW9I_32990 [[Kitasatospora] papulosa]|uniref:hypothetical protein n=1 Tax=[Kitasatospora] papulosa TaxID=1464011 RepID=UPI0036C6EB0D